MDCAALWQREFKTPDLAADGCNHHGAFLIALEWIAAQPRSLIEKVEAIGKLTALKGYNIVRLPEDIGW